MSHEGVVTPPARTPSLARMAGALIVHNPGHPYPPTDEDLSAAEPRRSIGTVRSSSKHRSAACLERPGWATKQAFVTKTGQPNSLSTASIRLARCPFQIESTVNAHALGSASQRIKLARLRPGSRRAPRATWGRVALRRLVRRCGALSYPREGRD